MEFWLMMHFLYIYCSCRKRGKHTKVTMESGKLVNTPEFSKWIDLCTKHIEHIK